MDPESRHTMPDRIQQLVLRSYKYTPRRPANLDAGSSEAAASKALADSDASGSQPPLNSSRRRQKKCRDCLKLQEQSIGEVPARLEGLRTCLSLAERPECPIAFSQIPLSSSSAAFFMTENNPYKGKLEQVLMSLQQDRDRDVRHCAQLEAPN